MRRTNLYSTEVNPTRIGEPATSIADGRLVQRDETIDCTLTDFQARQMGQKVVTHKETHKHPIVDDPLQVPLEGQIWHLEVIFDVLAKDGQLYEDKLLQRDIVRSTVTHQRQRH